MCVCVFCFCFGFFLSQSNQIKIEPSESESTPNSKPLTRKMKRTRSSERGAAGLKNRLGFEPEQILGANEDGGQIKFRIKVKNSDEWKIVNAHEAHAACPKLVIDFYEEHLILDGEPLSRSE